MGNVFAEITVNNVEDIVRVRDGRITEDNVRTVTLNALVDTGATTLVINEEIFNQLGLSVVEERFINLAGGSRLKCKVTSPVNIHWKNRSAAVRAVVMPQGKPLLGVIPLEFMDLIVDPINLELVGANGDEAILLAM
jgi:clan AA aspartic protease